MDSEFLRLSNLLTQRQTLEGLWVELFLQWLDCPRDERGILDAGMKRINEAIYANRL